jgi:hypothetical protein
MPHRELTINGQRIPSVTEWLNVLDKRWLRAWYAKEELARCILELDAVRSLESGNVAGLLRNWRERLREKQYAADIKAKAAAEIGIEFHTCVEKILRDQPYDASPAVAPLFAEFRRFAAVWKFKPRVLEGHVLSRRYVYHGTFDFLGETAKFDGLGVWDWKTSNKMDDTFGLQIALYAYAYGEQKGWTEYETWQKITHGGTVRLDKKSGKLKYKVYSDLPYLFRVAVALREPYDFLNKVGAWEETDNDRDNLGEH